MNNVLINACGIKSLGGINVLKSTIINIKKYSKVEILVSDQGLKKMLVDTGVDNIIVEQKPRFLHPFLLFFCNKELKDWVNSFDATIHFGNFGFKTKTKDIVFVQNILPYSKKIGSLKNLLLRYFINKSMEFSSLVIVQNNHVIDYLPSRFSSKIKSIGFISQTKINPSKGKGIIAISNDINYKNVTFIESVMVDLSATLSKDYKLTLVTDKKSPRNNSNISYKSTLTAEEIETELTKHSILLHASSIETLCLPIFEGQQNGLLIVAPNLDYALNATHEKKYLYQYQNIGSAIDAINKSIRDISSIKSLTINLYNQDWKEILK